MPRPPSTSTGAIDTRIPRLSGRSPGCANEADQADAYQQSPVALHEAAETSSTREKVEAMKLTKAVVKQFEQEQAQFGTRIALSNILWLVASSIMTGIGVTRLRVSYARRKTHERSRPTAAH